MIDFNKDGVYLLNEELTTELEIEMGTVSKEKLKQIEEYCLFEDVVWGHYKLFDLFNGNDQNFNPNSITSQIIKYKAQLLLNSFGNKNSETHSFVWNCFNELKVNKSKYDLQERNKVAQQKLEMNRISKLISTFENSKFFSTQDHLKLRFFYYQILGFTTNTGNFKYQKITKEEYENRCQEFQRRFRDCGDDSVVIYIKNCEKNFHYFWFKLNYLSNIFQRGFWKSTQYQQRISQLPTIHNGVLDRFISIFYHIFSFFYLFDDLFQSISKDLINPMLAVEYFISCSFFSILFYYHSRSVFHVPVEEFFSFKFSFIFGIFFGIFFIFFQGIPILCFYLIFTFFNYWNYSLNFVKSRFPSSIIQWIISIIFSIVSTLFNFIFIIIKTFIFFIFQIFKLCLLFSYYIGGWFLTFSIQILKYFLQLIFSLSYIFQILFLICFIFLMCRFIEVILVLIS
jgi:hypothetical protein